MTIKKKIEILTAKKENAYKMAMIYNEEGNEEMFKLYRREYHTLNQAIKILTDNSYAKDIAKIYEVEL